MAVAESLCANLHSHTYAQTHTHAHHTHMHAQIHMHTPHMCTNTDIHRHAQTCTNMYTQAIYDLYNNSIYFIIF